MLITAALDGLDERLNEIMAHYFKDDGYKLCASLIDLRKQLIIVGCAIYAEECEDSEAFNVEFAKLFDRFIKNTSKF